MSLVALVITACLAGQCGERRVVLTEGYTLRQCQTVGMWAVASWAAQHPWLRVTRWRCEAGEPRRGA